MKLSDGLFLKCAREVADEYPFIRFEEKPRIPGRSYA